MGEHSFKSDPDLFAAGLGRELAADYVAGIIEDWNMPVTIWKAPEGFDTREHPDNYSHHTLTVPYGGTDVARVRSSGSIIEQDRRSRSFVCFQPAAQDLRFICDGPKKFAHIYCKPSLLESVASEITDSFSGSVPFLDRVFGDDRKTRACAEAYLSRATNRYDPPSTLEMDSLAALLAIQIIRAHTALPERSRPTAARKGGMAAWQVRQVCEFLETNIARDVSLAELSGVARLSSFHLCRAFKLSMGLSPHAWLTRRRIERAKELLRHHPVMGLTEVALCVGYSSQSAFGTAFRRVTGTSPTAWRRERLS